MTSIEDIEVIREWPACEDNVWKAPTKLAYAAENDDKMESDKWGYAVPAGALCYTWTKLLLEARTSCRAVADSSLRDVCGEKVLQVPPGKTARDVCQDYMKGLYNYLVKTLKRRYGDERFAATPMDCWVTVPAIWSDKAQDLTRDAALCAGFGGRNFDTLNVISEPEAAALTVLAPRLRSGAAHDITVSPGFDDAFAALFAETLVAAGQVHLSLRLRWRHSGTWDRDTWHCRFKLMAPLQDLITYKVLELEPRLKFRELCVGDGEWSPSTCAPWY
jgi:hypothetical protein